MTKKSLKQSNYSKLDKLTGGIKKFLKKKMHKKITSGGYMPLTVEVLTPESISMTHYYEMNGDLVPDPDMTLKIDTETRSVESLSFQNIYIYQQVYSEDGIANKKLQKSLDSFLNDWLSNLIHQGFIQ